MSRTKTKNKTIEINMGRLGESLEKLKTAQLTHVMLTAIPDAVLSQFRPVLEAGLSDAQIISVLSQDEVATQDDLASLVPRIRTICDAVKFETAEKASAPSPKRGRCKAAPRVAAS